MGTVLSSQESAFLPLEPLEFQRVIAFFPKYVKLCESDYQTLELLDFQGVHQLLLLSYLISNI
jgi:hypothetical protein